jgi:hypothetical protein
VIEKYVEYLSSRAMPDSRKKIPYEKLKNKENTSILNQF